MSPARIFRPPSPGSERVSASRSITATATRSRVSRCTWGRLDHAQHAQGGARDPGPARKDDGIVTIIVSDVDRLYGRATTAGAPVVEALNETVYGERQFVVRDPDGHHWLIAQHIRDVAPDEWGATPRRPSSGQPHGTAHPMTL